MYAAAIRQQHAEKRVRDTKHNRSYAAKNIRIDPVAAYDAAMLLEAEHGSPSAAQQYFYIAASGGYTPAMIRLACFLMSGSYLKYLDNGVSVLEMNKPEAVKWLQKAASLGDKTAHYLLARCCVDGVCMNKSLPDARSHLEWVDFGSAAYEPVEVMAFGAPSDEMKALIRELANRRPGKLPRAI